jgi:cytosol alanyl aminopeptidase
MLRRALFPLAFLALSCSGGASSGPSGADPVMPPPAGGGAPAVTEAPVEAPTPPALRLGDEVVPTRYRIALDLDPDQPVFTGNTEIEVEVKAAVDHIWLHGTDLDVTSAELVRDGQPTELTVIPDEDEDFLGFTLPAAIPAGPATLRISYLGKVADKELEGVFRQEEKGEWYLYTQFEPTAARRAFPSFDEPRFKVPFQVTITVPAHDLAFSNTPVLEESSERGKRTLTFGETKPLPTYLVAFAAGPFEIVDLGTIGHGDTPARVIVPKGRTAEAAYATKSIPALLDRLEEYFGMAYPYRKLDSIALPSFFGAMEHPGLVTYAASILLQKPDEVTARWERRHSTVVSHELAHQWFGNLVTLAWWDDIWLNESFASWMGEKAVAEWKPEWEGAVAAVAARDQAMGADSLVTARQIRQPIETKHDIARAFDAITYAKGGAVLAMFERWVGEEAFRKGVRQYMKDHAWKTATATDFLAAIGAASDAEVPAAFKTFLDQPGVPLLDVTLTCDKQATPALEIAQSRFTPMGAPDAAAGQTWHIPVCVKYGSAGKAHTTCELIASAEARLELKEARGCPTWILPNAEGAGYYRTAYPDGMLEKLFGTGRRHLTVADRIGVIGDMSALVSTGRIGIGESLAIVPTLLRDKNDHIVREAAQIVAGVDDRILPPELEPNYGRLVVKLFGKRARQLGWAPRRGESDTTKMMRPLLVSMVATDGGDKKLAAEAHRRTEQWLESREGITPDMLEAVLGTAAHHGDKALWEKFAAALEATDDRSDRGVIIGAMASFDSAELAKRNLQLFLDKGADLDLRQSFTLLMGPLAHRDTRELAYQFVKDNLDTILERLPAMAKAYIIMVSTAFCDQEHIDEARAYWGPKSKDIPGGPQILEQALETMQVCVTFKQSQQPKLVTFLKKY